MSHQIYGYGFPPVARLVTERRGSWRHQDAYRVATYAPQVRADGKGYYWVSIPHMRTGKFALLQRNRDTWQGLRRGSLHGRPAHTVVDDYGNLLFVTAD